jgi:hypothetical protein
MGEDQRRGGGVNADREFTGLTPKALEAIENLNKALQAVITQKTKDIETGLTEEMNDVLFSAEKWKKKVDIAISSEIAAQEQRVAAGRWRREKESGPTENWR